MDTQTHPLIGVVVEGRYQVDDFVARGGMATVYRATDLRLDRVVAIKVMHANLAQDPEFVSRFVREARSAAKVSNPSIVAVYDQGSSDGLVYLVMEYIEGHTLRDHINKVGRLASGDALSIVEPVLEALQAAHKAGMAHRDIKPENILIATDGGVKVADFGLARAIEATNASAVTRGLLIGTVAYLAPEQVEHGAADARTDVYSAGIVLYECVVGQAPFTGETPLSVAYQHVHGNIPAPSSIRPDVPQAIDELVATATQRNPDDRYVDASDFLDNLRVARTKASTPAQNSNTVVLDRSENTVTVGPWPTAPVTASPDSLTVITTPAPHAPAPIQPVNAQATGTPAHMTSIEPITEPAAAQPLDSQPPNDTASNNLKKKERRPRRLRFLIALMLLILLGVGTGVGIYAYTQSQLVSVPGLVGLSPTEAQKKLTPEGLTVNVSGQEYSNTIRKGLIIASDVSPGSQLRKGQSVNVKTSAGPETVAIPKVVGLTTAKAKKQLRAVGFTSSVTEEYSSYTDSGRIISSSPDSGTKAKIGSEVTLVASKGPPPVTVPNVVTMDKATAVSKLQALGFNVQVKDRLSVVVFGRVYSQSPSAGAVLPRGSTIVLTVV